MTEGGSETGRPFLFPSLTVLLIYISRSLGDCMKLALISAAVISAAPAAAAQIQIAPSTIYIIPAGSAGYGDVVIPTIGIRAGLDEEFTVGIVRIELLADGLPVETRLISGGEMARDTAGLMEAPVPAFVDGQLLAKGGLEGFFQAPTVPAATARLKRGDGLVLTKQYFATRSPVDSVRVTLEGISLNGQPMSATGSARVNKRATPIDYRAPLSGTWLMQAIPSLHSHHRLNASTEFAVDFMKVDGDGRLYEGDLLKAESFYGFGAPVMAAADGVVVRVTDGAVQDRAATTRRKEETPQAAGQRIGMYNLKRMKSDFVRAVAGNLVTIKHEKGGVAEYSSYGHLKAGIPVREGQVVKQGEIVGYVGDTGDSATVHLHFQLNAGNDPFSTPSLPVAFGNLRPVGGNPDLGRFMSAN